MRADIGKGLFGLVLLLSCVLGAVSGAMADEPSRVVIVPFEIHADRDLSFLKEGIVDMLTSRLTSEESVVIVGAERDQVLQEVSVPIDEKTARAMGARLQADYVLFGSLTALGSSVSLDGRMVDVHERRPTLTFYKQCKEMGEVIPQINLFATEIRERVSGSPMAIPAPPPRAPKRPAVHAAPDTVMTPEPTDEVKVPIAKPAPAAPLGFVKSGGTAPADMTTAGSWKSQGFKLAIKGIALGDVNGDGETEVVFIDDQSVYVHRFEDQRLVKIWEKAGKGRFLGVDVADVNGNGRAEIFVTSVKRPGYYPNSFVLEWDGGGFETVSKEASWYYRVINVPDQGRVLIGQQGRREDLFLPGVYQLSSRDGEYGPDERLTLPKGINIFAFALGDVMNNGQQMIVAFDEGDHLRIFSSSGEEKWKSGEPYGGSMNYLESLSGSDDLSDRLYLPQRIYIDDLDGDGKHEVLVASNQGAMGRLFAHLRRFSSGHMAALSWQGIGLTLTRQTPQISGYISDYAIGDLDHDGRDEVVVAQVSKEGKIIRHDRSSIVAYQLTQPFPAQ